MVALADLGQDLASWMLWMSMWTLALFSGARIADLATRRLVAARWRILYYVAIPLRLLLPVTWSAPLAIGNAAVLGGAVPISPVRVTGAPPPAAAGMDGSAFDVFALVLPVHLLVAAVLALLWCRAHRRLVLAECEGTVGPAVVGILRPRIALPRSPCPADGRDRVLAHEQAHLARRDPLVSALMRLICTVLWPILPLTFAARRVRLLMEIACDDRALRGATPAERKAYMRTLCALSLTGRPSPSPAFGEGRGLTARIRETSRPSCAPTGLQIAMALLFPALLLGCAGVGSSSQAYDEPVDYILVETYPHTRDDGSMHVTLMASLLAGTAAANLDDPHLTRIGEAAWVFRDTAPGAIQRVFPFCTTSPDFACVDSPPLLLLSGQPGSITKGRVGKDAVLESGYRLEATAVAGDGGLLRLSIRFVQKNAGLDVRTCRVVAVVPEGATLVLRTRPGAIPPVE